VDYVPRKARRDYAPQSMYDVLKGFGRRVALPRFLEMEKELRGYLAIIVLDALRQAEDTLYYPTDLKVEPVPPEKFQTMKLEAAAQSYRPFGLMSSIDGTEDLSAEAKRELRERRNEQRLLDMDARLS
jgi:hypothetical protein